MYVWSDLFQSVLSPPFRYVNEDWLSSSIGLDVGMSMINGGSVGWSWSVDRP